jgi:integrase
VRGLGTIYKRGSIWWTRYWHRGQEFRESSHSDNEADARRLLRKRLGEIGSGKLIGPAAERVGFEDLAKALTNDYEVNRKRSIRSAELSIRHLRNYFGLHRAVDIRTDQISDYVLVRRQEGAANGSINRELSCLKRMFNLALKAGRLSHAPYIPLLDENNARQGFLDHNLFITLRQALPDYLRDPVSFLYLSGWRLGEMQTLQWRDVDVAGKLIRLRAEHSKNKATRILPLAGELLEVIERARDSRRLDCQLVFHRQGRPIGDFRKAWSNACRSAAVDGLIVHDLRRSAIRNMVRAGIPERVAMALSGHKTRSVFDRYNIVSEADLAEASERLHAHLASQQSAGSVRSLSKVRDLLTYQKSADSGDE